MKLSDDLPVKVYVHDAYEWDTTYAWEDRSEATVALSPGDVVELNVLVQAAWSVFAVQVPILWDDDGDPCDWEPQYFTTEKEAGAAR